MRCASRAGIAEGNGNVNNLSGDLVISFGTVSDSRPSKTGLLKPWWVNGVELKTAVTLERGSFERSFGELATRLASTKILWGPPDSGENGSGC